MGPEVLNQQAKMYWFYPNVFVPSSRWNLSQAIVAALSKSNVKSINEILRQFNGMRLSEDRISLLINLFIIQLAEIKPFPFSLLKLIAKQAYWLCLLPDEQEVRSKD